MHLGPFKPGFLLKPGARLCRLPDGSVGVVKDDATLVTPADLAGDRRSAIGVEHKICEYVPSDVCQQDSYCNPGTESYFTQVC